MMQRIAIFIALATIATVSVFTGNAAVAEGNPCYSSAFSVSSLGFENAVWRMEVRVDEVAYNGPSIRDRLNYNWNDEAKIRYRWTSTSMPVDTGMSTQMLEISAAVIEDGVPLLERGDIVDVAVVLRGIDYTQGHASAILKRVCSGREEGCLDELRNTQEGIVSGVEIKEGNPLPGHWRFSPPYASLSCFAPTDVCRGKIAAVLP